MELAIVELTIVELAIVELAIVELAIEHLTEWQPNYYLLNTNVNHFNKENRIKNSISSKGVILQLPLEVVKRQTPSWRFINFPLFQSLLAIQQPIWRPKLIPVPNL